MPLDGVSPVSSACERERHQHCRRPNACDCSCHDTPGRVTPMPRKVGDVFRCAHEFCDRTFASPQGASVHYARTHGPHANIPAPAQVAVDKHEVTQSTVTTRITAIADPLVTVTITVPFSKMDALRDFIKAVT